MSVYLRSKIGLMPTESIPVLRRVGMVAESLQKYLYVKACLPALHTTDDCSDPNLKQMLLIEPMFIERDYKEKT